MKPWIRNNYRSGRKGWKQEYTLSKSNFTGGLNNVKPPNVIADNELVDCKNMRIIDKAIMEKRPGTSVFKNVNDRPVVWVDWFETFNNGKILVTATSDKIWFGDESYDVAGDVTGVTYMNRYYYVDGTYIRYYDPDKSKVFKIVEEPIAHVVKTETIKVTREETEIEEIDKIYLDNIPDTVDVDVPVFILGISYNSDKNFNTTVLSIDKDNKCVEIKDHIVITGTGFNLQENAPILFYNPLGKQYTSGEEKYDDEKGIAYYLPCTQELADSVAGESYIPDKPTVITVHKNRLIVSGDSEMPYGVFLSRINQPLYFPSGTSLSVNATGEKILSMFVFDDCLIVGRHSDVFAVYGESEYNEENMFRVKKLDTTAGFISPHCGALLNNYYFYLGSDGRFYMMTTPTTNGEYLMTKTLGYKCDIYKSPLGANSNVPLRISSVSFNNEVYFAISDGVVDFVIVYNFDVMGFTYFIGWNAVSLCVDDNQIYIGAFDGNVRQYLYSSQVYNDCGEAIECNILTKQFEPYGNVVYKYFRMFMITAFAWQNLYSYIDSYVYVDFNELHLKEAIPANASLFDSAIYDSNKFDWESGIFKSFWYYIDARGRIIQYRFCNNNLDEGMRIYDINAMYSMRDVR